MKTAQFLKCFFLRVEHATRYKEKVKAGEIAPHVPEWQRLLEEKKKVAEKKLLEKEERKLAADKKKQENERLRMERLLEKQRRQENDKKILEIERRREDNRRKKEEFLLKKELQKIERELKMEERIKIRLAKQRRRRKPSKWAVFRQNNPHPYQRSFIPRHTKVGDRAAQNFS